ncbi:MAG: hypothetical protein DWP97_07270 [Calditrichaeota bacterium]|nr:MAG: hypothetical protein DWP97_07270 [Calditrichota bacterium]
MGSTSLRFILFSFLLIITSGCSDDPPTGGDENPPSVEILSPLQNDTYYLYDSILFSANVTFNYTHTENNLEWNSSIDGLLSHDDSVFIDTLSLGTHQIQLSAADKTNTPKAYDSVTISIVENMVPEPSIIVPGNDSVLNLLSEIKFIGTATDFEDGQLSDSLLEWYSDIDGYLGSGDTLVVDSLSNGEHIISLRAVDFRGAVGIDSVRISTVLGYSPTVEINSPDDSTLYLIDEYVVFSTLGGVDIEDGSITGADLTWNSSIDGPIGIGTTLVTNSLSDGLHSIYLHATDSHGNTSVDSIFVRVTISWEKTFSFISTDFSYSFYVESDNSYIFTGTEGEKNIFLAKTDSKGVLQWKSRFSSYDAVGYDLIKTSDQHYLVAGKHSVVSGDDPDLVLVKFDLNGDEIWSTSVDSLFGDVGSSVIETHDGGYIVAGHTNYQGSANVQVGFLVKFDASGNLLWVKNYPTSPYSCFTKVFELDDHGYLLMGLIGQDFYMLKTDSMGVKDWDKVIDRGSIIYGYSIIQALNGNYYISGRPTNTNAPHYFYMLEIDDQGTVLQEDSVDIGYRVLPLNMVQKSDGNLVTIGSDTRNHIMNLQFNSSGLNIVWHRIHNTSGNKAGYSIDETIDHGYIVSGMSQYEGVYLLKLDSLGNLYLK